MIKERLPFLFPKNEGEFKGWVEAHDSEVESLQNDIDQLKKSLQIDQATGGNLDRIGERYGIFGRRKGRNDDEYRQYLKSLITAYGGKGRKKDVRFALKATLAITDSDINIIEDEANNEYEIEIKSWDPHVSDVVEQAAEISDPAAVPLVDPIHMILDDESVVISAEDVNVSSGGYGLSSSSLGNFSSGEWNFSDATP